MCSALLLSVSNLWLAFLISECHPPHLEAFSCHDSCGIAAILRASSYEPGNQAGPVSGTNFVFCSYGKFKPGYRDEKCPNGPQNTREIVFRLVSDLANHVQLKMFRPEKSRYPGWSVHMGNISSSVTEISVTEPACLLI